MPRSRPRPKNRRPARVSPPRVTLQPPAPNAYALLLDGLGLLLDRAFDDALGRFDAALRARPTFPSAHLNRAMLLHALGRFDEALSAYDRAFSGPAAAEFSQFHRALLLLSLGRFRDGWRAYEARRQHPDWLPRQFPRPEWHGEELRGKRIFLWGEQGLGDVIQFARFGPLLAARGVSVILEVPIELSELMQSLGEVMIVGPGDAVPAFDYHLPLMSVPHRLNFDPQRSPATGPYLRVDPIRVAAWSLPAGDFRVGIAWHTGAGEAIDGFNLGAKPLSGSVTRSVPLRDFAPLSRVPGVRLVSLQKHNGLEQLKNLPAGMRVDAGEIEAVSDFVDTAALMMHLDLIVAPDTVTAHLAGALGRPVWVVVNEVPDWRWMIGREDSPWYPTARLFRKQPGGGWGEVVQRIAAELARLVAAPPPLIGRRAERPPDAHTKLGAQILAALNPTSGSVAGFQGELSNATRS